jgi:hypothetical protein
VARAAAAPAARAAAVLGGLEGAAGGLGCWERAIAPKSRWGGKGINGSGREEEVVAGRRRRLVGQGR